jgi:cyanophycinase
MTGRKQKTGADMLTKIGFSVRYLTFIFVTVFSFGQGKVPSSPTFFLSGSGSYDDTLAINSFVTLAGGPDISMVFIPSASSGLKLPNGYIFIPPKGDTTASYISDFENELVKIFGVRSVKVLHTRDRRVADSEPFVSEIRKANAVWFSGGNAGRLADAFLKTKTQTELEALSARGGVIAGNSAGAIILGSYIVRGWTAKPMLMAKGHDKGFGFIKNVAINPHLITAKREYELISVVHEYPKLLGIGIDDYAFLVFRDNKFEVGGKGKVAIYDNKLHGKSWYYWLKQGDVLDMTTRKVATKP